MKLPPVDYEAPKTVSEAVELLAEHQDEASVLAGGQSLIPLLALRMAHPAVLIDINGIDELSGVSATDGWVAIGAMTREYVAEESETIADAVPLLAAALPLIGHEAIRSRGTVGGSLAHADPAAEPPAGGRARCRVRRPWPVGRAGYPGGGVVRGISYDVTPSRRAPHRGALPGRRARRGDQLPGGRPPPRRLRHCWPGGIIDAFRGRDQRCPAGVCRP